jgi:hypothetical protein
MQLHGRVRRPARARGLEIRSHAAAPRHVKPAQTMPAVSPVLRSPLFVCHARERRRLLAFHGDSVCAVQALGFAGGPALTPRGGRDVLGHGNTVRPGPCDLLLVREATALSPALLGRPATAPAMLTWESLARSDRGGATGQRHARADQNLLRNEQPGRQSSHAWYADRKHALTSIEGDCSRGPCPLSRPPGPPTTGAKLYFVAGRGHVKPPPKKTRILALRRHPVDLVRRDWDAYLPGL